MSDRPVDGSVLPLISIKRILPFKYCPLAIDYFINYDLIPEEDTVKYCQQSNDEFYDIIFDIIPEESNVQYCPQESLY